MSAQTTPILLDTDVGTDIDDALAIAYLLAEPRCDLLGITTVAGESHKRAAIAKTLCTVGRKPEVPIRSGHSKAITPNLSEWPCEQYDLLPDRPNASPSEPNKAIEFLREMILANPNELTLLTIGQFTNIAQLVMLDPTILTKVHRIVSMAGSFFSDDQRETNFSADPLATGIVLNASRSTHTWFGLDVTTQCKLSPEEAKRQFVGPLLEPVAQMAQGWFLGNLPITFHDPLAAASIFHPNLCTYVSGTVSIELPEGGSRLRCGNHVNTDQVATDVEPQQFRKLYLDTVHFRLR